MSDTAPKPTPPAGPWGITPEALETLTAARVARADIAAMASDGDATRPGLAPMRRAGRSGQIGVIDISGPMDQRPQPWGWLLGMGPSYQEISAALDSLEADRTITAIVLDIDSPGGVVAGAQALSSRIKSSPKPVYAYTGADMASAAYWIASGAREIWAAETAQIGSIGVIATHVDLSARDERAGVKRTLLTAGRYKAAGSPSAPLDDDSRAYLQARIDEIYGIFRRDVASSRPVLPEDDHVWADGQIFLAKSALAAGLIDRIAPHLGDLTRYVEGKMTENMTAATLRAQYPAAVQELRADILSEQAETAKNAVASAEKTAIGRVMALASAVLGEGDAAKLRAVVDSGVTPETMAALKAAGLVGAAPAPAAQPPAGPAPSEFGAQMLAAIQAATPPPLASPAGSATGAAAVNPAAEFEAIVSAEMADGKKTRAIAIRDAGQKRPDLKAAWLDAQQKGGVK